MAGRKVYVIWSHPLFHESVRLLLQHPGVELVGANSNRVAARDEIARLHPDVVIVEGAEDDEGNEETVAILREGPQVIRMSLTHNELNHYRHEHHTVKDAGELLRLVTEVPDLGSPPEKDHE